MKPEYQNLTRSDQILSVLRDASEPMEMMEVAHALDTTSPNCDRPMQEHIAKFRVTRKKSEGVWVYTITEAGRKFAESIKPDQNAESLGLALDAVGGLPMQTGVSGQVPAPVKSGEHGPMTFQEPPKRPYNRRASADLPEETGEAKFGAFTNGELQIVANGKNQVLSKKQSAALIEFVMALPNRWFVDSPRLSDLPSRRHGLSDD